MAASLAGCSHPSPDQFPAAGAVIVYGFACRAFLEDACTIEFARLAGDAVASGPEDRLRSRTGDENLYRFHVPGSTRTFAYSVHRVVPGTYALHRFTTVRHGKVATFAVTDARTDRPYAPFAVQAGTIQYLGDFTFYTTPFKEETPVERQDNPAAARAFLAAYPGLSGTWVTQTIDFGP